MNAECSNACQTWLHICLLGLGRAKHCQDASRRSQLGRRCQRRRHQRGARQPRARQNSKSTACLKLGANDALRRSTPRHVAETQSGAWHTCCCVPELTHVMRSVNSAHLPLNYRTSTKQRASRLFTRRSAWASISSTPPLFTAPQSLRRCARAAPGASRGTKRPGRGCSALMRGLLAASGAARLAEARLQLVRRCTHTDGSRDQRAQLPAAPGVAGCVLASAAPAASSGAAMRSAASVLLTPASALLTLHDVITGPGQGSEGSAQGRDCGGQQGGLQLCSWRAGRNIREIRAKGDAANVQRAGDVLATSCVAMLAELRSTLWFIVELCTPSFQPVEALIPSASF
jgi:hypothetical protein